VAPLYSTSVRVEAPPQRVFAHLADVNSHPRWSGEAEFGLQSLELLTPGPVQLGTRFRSVGRNASGTPNHDLSEVTAFDPPRRIGWDTRIRLGPARALFAHRYDLVDEEGATRLTYSLERADALSPAGWVFLFFLKHVAGKKGEAVVTSGLRAFTRYAERHEAPASMLSAPRRDG
jgi:uncharacterized protein YndB with AHSA1/START domain